MLLKRIYRSTRRLFFHPQWIAEIEHRRVRALLRQIHGCCVLDIGSGDSSHPITDDVTTRLVKIDYPSTNNRYRGRPDIYGDARRLPFADGAFDVILLLEVIEHIDNDTKVLDEITRVLRPGGRLHLSAPFIYPLHDSPVDYRRYTKYGLEYLLRSAGLKVVDCRPVGRPVTTWLQLTNLTLLHTIHSSYQKNRLTAVLMLVIATIPMFFSNLAACLFLFRRRPASATHLSLGHYLVAEKSR